jgi:hypothetical protein
MRDNKAFASLSSGLLARKGQARPAMRPQGIGFGHVGSEDLGWNDMGHDAGPRTVTARLPANLSGPQPDAPAQPELPPVVRQQEEIAREFAQPAVVAEVLAPKERKARVTAPKKESKVVAMRAEGRKAAFTLRLDAERHLRLRLACAVQNRSAQVLVTHALDQLLETLPDVARMAASLPQ